MVSLWHARLFPVFKECIPSVQHTLQILCALREGHKLEPPSDNDIHGTRRLSMADVLTCKDVKNTLKLREKLREKIFSFRAFK